jgi:transcriptional regulator with XRE-family HTH domain
MTAIADTFTKAVAGAVRAELGRRQRTISEAAAAIGVSRGQLSKLLNARKPFDTDQLEAIAAYLGIPVEIIFESAAISAALNDEDVA